MIFSPFLAAHCATVVAFPESPGGMRGRLQRALKDNGAPRPHCMGLSLRNLCVFVVNIQWGQPGAAPDVSHLHSYTGM